MNRNLFLIVAAAGIVIALSVYLSRRRCTPAGPSETGQTDPAPGAASGDAVPIGRAPAHGTATPTSPAGEPAAGGATESTDTSPDPARTPAKRITSTVIPRRILEEPEVPLAPLSREVAVLRKLRERDRLQARGVLPTSARVRLLAEAADEALRLTPGQQAQAREVAREMGVQVTATLSDNWAAFDRLEERYLRLFHTDDGHFADPGTDASKELDKQMRDLEAQEQETILDLDKQFQGQLAEVLSLEQAECLSDSIGPETMKRLVGETPEP